MAADNALFRPETTSMPHGRHLGRLAPATGKRRRRSGMTRLGRNFYRLGTCVFACSVGELDRDVEFRGHTELSVTFPRPQLEKFMPERCSDPSELGLYRISAPAPVNPESGHFFRKSGQVRFQPNFQPDLPDLAK